MSRENVEVVRQADLAASTSAARPLGCVEHDPDVELCDPATRRGQCATADVGDATGCGELLQRWDRLGSDRRRRASSEFIDAGRHASSSITASSDARGRASGARVELRDGAASATFATARSSGSSSYADPRRGPRSRGAAGVGDVAGERGGGAGALRGVERAVTSTVLGWRLCDPGRRAVDASRDPDSASCLSRGRGLTRARRAMRASLGVVRPRRRRGSSRLETASRGRQRPCGAGRAAASSIETGCVVTVYASGTARSSAGRLRVDRAEALEAVGLRE